MFEIGEAVIENTVTSTEFRCDLEVCKGACCTLEGGRGAPLEDDEVLEIQKAYPIVKQFLDSRNRETIEREGLVEGTPGGYATVCIDRRDCVFVYREEGIAKCGFEKAYVEGRSDWRKPLSCHLFPLRVRRFGKEFVRYEMIDECAGGRSKGEEEGTKLYEISRDPLVRKFGASWYEEFLLYCTTKVS